MAGLLQHKKVTDDEELHMTIKAVVGLGNPGNQFIKTRHNIGFRVLDALAKKYEGDWHLRGEIEFVDILIDGQKIILLKPQTFMNASGRALSFLTKQGIKPDEILVVHDELELPFGKVTERLGGSARGHNGLRSIISTIGENFHRIRCGVGRPPEHESVSDFVLKIFSENDTLVQGLIDKAIGQIEAICSKKDEITPP